MCESDVYLKTNGKEELFMKEAARIEIEDDRVEVYGLLGDKKQVSGKVKKIDFLKHRVVVEKL
ncbi:MAG: RNA-binding protein [Candidatus Altiarchaeales archaeon WOR_SM1_86-2]|nr:MAG: RNA-binding protein [Candidatus Altiarchaeales archaeon WOR_SM1_79]ODS39650.1 MAG: RNA-binding protein [Candidatus Altiarchaeales archaeon WOR_SM1_86-2]